MAVELGKVCPGCLTEAKGPHGMLLYSIGPDRTVCGECFDKVKAAERQAGHGPFPHQGNSE